MFVLVDFNARVSRDPEAWKRVLAKYVMRNCYDNDRLPLEFCVEQQLTISNTIF